MSSSQITAREWRWAISWSIAILLISCIPYVIATLTAPQGWQFTGILVNPLDGQSYLAKMQQGVAGKWLFHLTYTPEPHDGAFIFTFYLALGRLAAWLGLSNILIFHLARLLAGFGLLLMAFRFIGRVISNPAERRLAFVLVLTASGLGWLGVAFGAFPIDLWVPEAFVPYSLYTNPHFPLAMMLMLIIFDRVIQVSSYEFQVLSFKFQVPDSTSRQPARFGSPLRVPASRPYSLLPTPYFLLWTGLAALALAMILPFALLTVWVVLTALLGWLFVTHRRLPWPQFWLTLSVVVFSAPVIAYQYWVSTTNPILAGWGAQNVTPAPRALDFWLGYGLVGLLALVGAGFIIRRDRENSTAGQWLVLLWAVTTVVLVYIPFDLQRRLITGLHLPLCILAAIGLSRRLDRSKLPAGYRRLPTMAVVTIGVLGTLLVWSFPLLGMMQPPAESATTALFFMRDEEAAAFEWLRANVEPDDVILASPRVGLFVPGQTGARTFYGHPFETIEAERKKAQAEAFYQGDIEAVTPPANFIIYGPSEQALGRPKPLSELSVVFSADDLLVYKVVK